LGSILTSFLHQEIWLGASIPARIPKNMEWKNENSLLSQTILNLNKRKTIKQ